MSVKSAPYYWLECDEPGCGVKSTEHDEFGAYDDPGYAAGSARDADWSTCVGPGLLDYCDDHWREECEQAACTTLLTRAQAVEHDDLCDVHWNETEYVETHPEEKA